MPTGRPPYGYRASAASGFEPDPVTAPVVRRIFADYLSGCGLQTIAERLTADRIARPSAYDPTRNPHHVGDGWSKAAVRAVLVNSRYTRTPCNPIGATVSCSRRLVGPEIPLVSPEVFRRAQHLFGQRAATPDPAGTGHPYLLRGLLRCELCQRLMQGAWNNAAAYYRCRVPREYARTRHLDHPANVYLREDRIMPALQDWICRVLPSRLAEWAGGQSPAMQRQLRQQVIVLRRLLAEARTNPIRSGNLFQALNIRLMYASRSDVAHLWCEVVPRAVFTDVLSLANG